MVPALDLGVGMPDLAGGGAVTAEPSVGGGGAVEVAARGGAAAELGRGSGAAKEVGSGSRARGGRRWAWRAAAVEAVAAPLGATGVGGGDVSGQGACPAGAEMIFRVSNEGGPHFRGEAFK